MWVKLALKINEKAATDPMNIKTRLAELPREQLEEMAAAAEALDEAAVEAANRNIEEFFERECS